MSTKPGTSSYTLVLSGAAQHDISQILQWTQEAFGDTGRTRYENLISTALVDLRADRTKVRQTMGKLRRRHGLVMSGGPREPGYAVEDWTWEARRVRSSVRGG